MYYVHNVRLEVLNNESYIKGLLNILKMHILKYLKPKSTSKVLFFVACCNTMAFGLVLGVVWLVQNVVCSAWVSME